MHKQIQHIKASIIAYSIDNPATLEKFRLQFLSKKGEIAALFFDLKTLPTIQKKEIGKALNELKQIAEKKYQSASKSWKKTDCNEQKEPLADLTLPPPTAIGSLHPITSTAHKIFTIFEHIGFDIQEGPEIETDWYNFTALNFPKNHPARAMQDTFFIDEEHDQLLRTHTSSIQIRIMEQHRPPLRTLTFGRVFRNEAISARTHCQFHQIEGFYIDKKVSFVDLKETLYYFVQRLFGKSIQLRFRPSYFPFTEPSAEIDISCFLCKQTGCKICKQTGWIEIGGAGMIDPQVLINCNIDPKVDQGFAFGIGVERITMIQYGIDDIRLFTENDVRFLQQFAIGQIL